MSAAGGRFFADGFHDEFGTWMLGYAPYGGGDAGEVEAVASAVGDGGDDEFFAAWTAAGDRNAAEAAEAAAAGHRASAADLHLRASACYASAYHPIYGAPVDPRLLWAYRRQVEEFDAGMALRPVPVRRFDIPLDGAAMPAYLIPAEGMEDEVRPVLILVNGYDATVTDVYFASAVAALRRGYHCLLFDGPGQGGMLYEQGVPLRPDWEVVVSAVIDAVIDLPIVDADRIAVSGWSLGGYLAPRAATGDPRISACIADPGQWDLGASLRGFARRLGATEEEVSDLSLLDDEFFARMMSVVQADRTLRWSIVQRGFWVNGVDDLRGLFEQTVKYTLRDRVHELRCPLLLTHAENDPLAAGAEEFAGAVAGPARVIRFTAAEGAGDHCEMHHRSLVNRRVLDWLDETFAVRGDS